MYWKSRDNGRAHEPRARWQALFGRLLPPDQRDAALGDAAEEFAARLERAGPAAAHRWYRRQVLRSIAPAAMRVLRTGGARRRPDERSRQMTGSWMGDFRLAVRTLARQRAFTVATLMMLAVGIGATTALFAVYRDVFLNPLPLPESNRLVFLMEQAHFGCCGPASGPDYVDWVARQRAFSGLGIINPGSFTLTGVGDAERVSGTAVSASLFDLLRVRPMLGRTFTAADQNSTSVVVLSYGLWQRTFGGRRDIVGTAVDINQAPATIVGVMPKDFDVPSPWLGATHYQLYVPFQSAWLQGQRVSHSYPVVAQLRPGATLETAQADMDRVMRELAREYPKTNADRTVKVFTVHDYMFGYLGTELVLILAAAGLVLTIACGNIAGLQLARATARESELAVRAALGATRLTLVRLLLSESLVIAMVGGLCGVCLAFLGVDALRAILPATMPRVDHIRVDRGILAFAIGISALTALACGVVPSLTGASARPGASLGTRGAGAHTPHKQRLRDAFIVVQIALGLVLANGAALLVRSYALVRSQAAGFKADGVLTMFVRPSGDRYKDPNALSAYYTQLLSQVAAVPGVAAVGTISRLPLLGGSNGSVLIEGRGPRASADSGPLVEVTSITGDYFSAMGLTLLRGRDLRPADDAKGVLNVVINQHFAQEAWPGEDPVGKRFSFTDNPPQWATVVGVVDDIREWGPEKPPVSQAYYTLSNGWVSSGYLVVRTAGDPGALAPPVRKAVLSVDPTQPASDVQTMTSRVDRTEAQRRFYTTVIALFALAALVLAAAGVYGTVSYYVARSERELGIRMVLGASGSGIVGLVVGHGWRLAIVGVALGLVAAWGSTSLLVKLLYGVAPLDVWTLAAGSATLAAVVLLASALPAVRATRVAPIVALRAE